MEARHDAPKSDNAALHREIADGICTLTLNRPDQYNALSDGLLEECAGPGDADPRRTYVFLTPLGRAVAEAAARRLYALAMDARGLDLLRDA